MAAFLMVFYYYVFGMLAFMTEDDYALLDPDAYFYY